MPGLGGGIARALGSDDVNVVTKVKNPAIQSAIDQALSNYKGYAGQEQSALGDYITKYLGQQGQFEKNVGQESGAIGQFYTGEMGQKLSALRQNRAAAVNAAADVGVKQALANVNRSRLGEQGGGSSYDRRLAIGAVLPIRTQAALDNANQERTDLGYVTQNQLGLTGQREALSNALASYGLVPYATAAGVGTRNLGQLSGITNLDQANKFYGLKKDKNTFADISDSIDSSVLSAASIYSSAGGGGGMKRGGLIWYDDGGMIHGRGGPHSDSITIHASKGEYILPASSVRLPGVLPLLRRIRTAGLASEGIHLPESDSDHFDVGGGVGASAGASAGGYDWSKMMGGGGGKSGGGGGGGGLSGEAMQLRDRAAQDQNTQWMGATIIPAGGGWGMPGTATGTSMPKGAGAMPIPNGNDVFNVGTYLAKVYGPEAVPSNFNELPPSAQHEYFDMYSRARATEKEWAGQPNPYE